MFGSRVVTIYAVLGLCWLNALYVLALYQTGELNWLKYFSPGLFGVFGFFFFLFFSQFLILGHSRVMGRVLPPVLRSWRLQGDAQDYVVSSEMSGKAFN